MSRAERFLFRVEPGRLVPADEATRERLREKGYHAGDVLSAQLSKPRNVDFHRLAHAFGQLVANNLDDFSGMAAHAVLKRLQWESGVGCEEMGVKVPGIGYTTVRVPLSLSFSAMDDGEFMEVFRGLCRHVAKTYWPGLSEDQIEEMARVMVHE